MEIIVDVARGLAERYDMEFEQLGCDRNHIHLLCSAHPKIAPGQIVRVFKSITGRELFRRKPALKKELWGGEFWSDGYYVGTVGEGGNWQVVETVCAKARGAARRTTTVNSLLIPRGLATGIFMCAWHDAQAAVSDESRETEWSAVTGRKDDANKARASSEMGVSGGSMRQNPCT